MSGSNFNYEGLLTVVKSNNYENVKLLLEKQGLKENNHRNNGLALIEAVKARNFRIVELLLSYGCLAEEEKSNIFYRSLDYTLDNEYDVEMLKLLLRAGASTAGKKFNRKTPLIRALQKKNFLAVDTMLSMYDLDSIDPTNQFEKIHYCIAIARNNRSVVEEFLKKGMNVNFVLGNVFEEWFECTPLHVAIQYLAVEVIEKLLSCGANFSLKDENNATLLHRVYYIWENKKSSQDCRHKAGSIIDLFLSAYEPLVNPIDANDTSYFSIACARNNITFIKKFLLNGVHLKVKKNTALLLHCAVEKNCPEAVDLLLRHGLKVNSKDSKGCTPLHIAVDCKYYEIAALLLTFKANVQIVDEAGYTPIHRAFFHLPETRDLIDSMFSTCSNQLENIKSPENLSLFHIACTGNNIRLIQDFMSECDIDINEHVVRSWSKVTNCQKLKCNGFTALHFAAIGQNLNVIKFLLTHDACIDATDSRRTPALWCALCALPNYHDATNFIIENFKDELKSLTTKNESVKEKVICAIFDHFKHIDILKLLLNSNLNYKNLHGYPLLFKAYSSTVSSLTSINFKNIERDIVFEICCGYFHSNAREILKLLISHGINRNSRDHQKNTIFHFIIDSMTTSKQITDIAIEVADLLISGGGNPNLLNQSGDSPLFMATKNGSIEFVDLLLKYNMDINSTDKTLKTPLHVAVQYHKKSCKMVHFLLKNGAKIDAKDVRGETPLFKTFQYGQSSLKVMELLLKAKCDVNAQDNYGRTVLSIAALNNDVKAVKILLDYSADINIKDYLNNSLFKLLRSSDDFNHLKKFSLSESKYFSVFKILAFHAFKLMLINHPISSENVHMCNVHPELFDPSSHRSLIQELVTLKESKLDRYTSLYDILFKTTQHMTRHVKNASLNNFINSDNFNDKFPNYGYIMTAKYQQGLARKHILKKAEHAFRLLTRKSLLQQQSSIDIDRIFTYLNNKDLENLLLV